jgi:hypothetical protein
MLSSTFSKIMLVGVMALAALLVPGILSGQSTVHAAPTCTEKPADNASSAGSVSFGDTDQPCVNTVAVVDPADPGNRPTVTNKFELPDMDPNTSGMQYTSAAVSACTTPQLAACYDVDGQDVPAKNTTDYAHAHDDDPTGPDKGDQMMVRPNLDDKPAKRMIEVWAVVRDPNGPGSIISVTTTVRDPNAAKKITFNLVKGHCDDLGAPTNVFSPVHAAQNTGQWAHGKACDPKVDTLWKGTFLLNNDQIPGKYTVRVHGNDNQGSGLDLENSFEVLQTLGFKVDFNTLNYGVIAPGFRQTIAGDAIVDQTVGVAGPPPSSGVKPTIANTGNAKWCLEVYSTQMAGVVSQKLNPINQFGAALNHNNVKYPAATWAALGNVQSKAAAQLDFSIDPPTFMQSDTYEGRTDLRVVKVCAP